MPLKLKKSMKLKNSAREQAREPLGVYRPEWYAGRSQRYSSLRRSQHHG